MDIDTELVARLIGSQFPQWSSLETDPAGAATARRVIDDVLDEHVHPD